MKKYAFVQHFNWRILLLRVLVNAGALLITAIVVPDIYFVDRRLLVVLWMALMLGVLNALVKPVVQFLTLPFIFATGGVVVVLINAGLLWLLSFLFPGLFAVNSFGWALLGGLVMGLLSSFLEALLGVTPPIVPEKYATLRQQVSRQSLTFPATLAQAASSGEQSGAPAGPAEATPVVEDLASPGAGPGAPGSAPVADSTGSEG
jgi:putative membrane protein